MPSTNLAYANERREVREEVDHRTVATTSDGRTLPVLVVNISPSGLMVRCGQPVDPGAMLTFRLPGLDPLIGEVRWTLGGRVGCQFTRPIPPNTFYATLARLRG